MITLLIEIQGTLMQVKSPFETILYIFRCSVATHFALLAPESSILILLYHISSDILLGISTVEQINNNYYCKFQTNTSGQLSILC